MWRQIVTQHNQREAITIEYKQGLSVDRVEGILQYGQATDNVENTGYTINNCSLETYHAANNWNDALARLNSS